MSFPKFDVSDELFVSAKQVGEFVKDDSKVFMILASMKVESKASIDKLPVVCEFPVVFQDDVSNFLPEHKVEFAIEFVLGTSLVSMDPYRMYILEFSKLNEKLEELLEKKFVGPSFRRGVHRCCYSRRKMVA